MNKSESFISGKKQLIDLPSSAAKLADQGYQFWFSDKTERGWVPPDESMPLSQAINQTTPAYVSGKIRSVELIVIKGKSVVGQFVFRGFPDVYGNQLSAQHAFVSEKKRGKGIAAAAYNVIQKAAKTKVMPSDARTPDAHKFWDRLRFDESKGKSFMFNLAKKQRIFLEGKEQISELLDRGQLKDLAPDVADDILTSLAVMTAKAYQEQMGQPIEDERELAQLVMAAIKSLYRMRSPILMASRKVVRNPGTAQAKLKRSL